MITLFAKFMMVVSFLFYAPLIIGFWLTAILGWHNDIWEFYDFPVQSAPPALWLLVLGLGCAVFAFASLCAAYVAIWKILNGGARQDFRILARRLRKLALGLFGFWLGFNLITGGIGYLIKIFAEDPGSVGFDWDPFGVDVIYLIMSIALYAISNTLHRAWEAEEEARHFV